MKTSATKSAQKRKPALTEEIVGKLARQHSMAVVLFHHAVAERLGLGPTDHKCLDLLRDRGAMAGSDLGAITGLTSGAITGVVARLERAGYLHREPDPHDGRKQILRLIRRPAHISAHVQDVIEPLRNDVATLLKEFDHHQITAIAKFLSGCTDRIYHHAAMLRAQTLSASFGGTNPRSRKQ
ncbi:MAG TPA: MarR family transcriptional regulator [Acidobacteriaceae bacterium]|nr:MarR family transcriptional regulator [Acidobacteriaceae bacterium]